MDSYVVLGDAFWTGFWIALAVQAVVCGLLSAFVANAKWYNTGSWFPIGFFCGVFGLIAAAGLPDRRVMQELRGEETSKPHDRTGKEVWQPHAGRH